jgi:hypothetical protein
MEPDNSTQRVYYAAVIIECEPIIHTWLTYCSHIIATIRPVIGVATVSGQRAWDPSEFDQQSTGTRTNTDPAVADLRRFQFLEGVDQ